MNDLITKTNRTIRTKITGIINNFSLLLLFFLSVFGYFFWFGNYILFFQENQSLFLYSGRYFHDFLIKPGGITVLSGKFLTQFYSNELAGSVILATIFATLFYLFTRLFKNRKFSSSLSLLLSLIPSCLLVLMQTHYYHFMEVNLGYLSVILFLIFSIYLSKRNAGFIVLILFPLYYYLTGAFAWIFAGAYIAYSVFFENKKYKYLHSFLLIPISALIVFISENLLFLQPYNLLFSYPLPAINDSTYRILFYLLSGYFVLTPLISKFKFTSKSQTVRPLFITIASVLVLLLTGYLLYTTYNIQTSRVLKTEKYVFEQKWNEAIRFNEKKSPENLIGQYFYNVALSETDQLCDKLFYGRQDFKVGSLILPWGNEHLGFGSYFYYAIGLVNEAQRWAYEDMVVNGQRPENLKMLVKTNLIDGNCRMAKKYIGILKKTLYHKAWAVDYEKMVEDTTLINNNAELKQKRLSMPKGDFFIHVNSAQDNIPHLIESNPNNRRAFEYKIAWMMLSKDEEGVVNQIKNLKTLGYSRIPRHMEEAAMIYYNGKGVLPDLGGLIISNETFLRFDQYVAAFKSNRQNMALAKERLRARFGNTFMFYYHFK